MNLHYILLSLDYDTYITSENKLRFEFQQKTNFINDYFSKALRKYKFKTDGTFKMLSIACTEYEIKPSAIEGFDVLNIELPFDRNRYEKIKNTDDSSYYLELLEKGFKKASKFKSIPLEALLSLIVEFKVGGCKNEWLHKKKKFKEHDLEITLSCQFTANYFQLVVSVVQMSSKTELVRGVVIRTETGVSIHEGFYKNILIEKDIIITDSADSPVIKINLKDIFRHKLNFKIYGDAEFKKIMSFSPNGAEMLTLPQK